MPDPLAYLLTLRCHKPVAGAPPTYSLGEVHRDAVLESIRRVCRHRGWALRAAGVLRDHAGVVVATEEAPAIVLQAFQNYASRLLEYKSDRAERRWAASGSTLYLWRPEDVAAAVRHVTAGDGAIYREGPVKRLGKWAAVA